MPIPQLPGSLNTVDDIKNYIMRLERELRFLMESGLDSTNAFEFGGWRVKPDQIISKDGDVGMSTADTAADDVRFFAGPNGDVWFFYVTKSGKLYATDGFFTGRVEGSVIIGSEIMTAEEGVYPRSAMSAADNLFSAEVSPGYGVYIVPDYSLTTPAILFNESGATRAIITLGTSPLSFAITTTGTTDISIQSANDLVLSAGGLVKFDSWNKIYSVGNTQTLQQALDAITSSIPSGDYAVVTYSGGVATSGRSLISSDIPNIAESQVTNLVTDLAAKANKTQPTMTAISWQNGWSNFGLGYEDGGYYIDSFGTVHLYGMFAGGSTATSTVLFNITASLRPSKTILRNITSNNAGVLIISSIEIRTNGDVVITGAMGNSWAIFEDLTYRL